MVSSLAWTTWTTRSNLNNLALVQARAVSENDVLYRRWGSSFGGIYVNMASGVIPNALLKNHPDRDLETLSGQKLTLVNPEYMSQMVYDLEGQGRRLSTGMTSLEPLNPRNEPDRWEMIALKQLQEGASDVSIIEDRPEGRFLRLITPLRAELGCLQCHNSRGYELGEICGGLTVVVPMQPYEQQARNDLFNQGITHALIWLFGLLTIGLGFRKYATSEWARRRTENELIAAKLVAESASRAKGDFLANMSHEVRTPMNAILGMTELVLDTELHQHQRDCLETVKTSADSLLGLINDVLDFSKIEAGMLKFEMIPFRLRDLVDEAMRTTAVPAHRKGLEMVGSVAAEVPDCLFGDPLRIRQVLLNLLGNAVKFTEQGAVVLHVDLLEQVEANTCHLSFSVKDSGIGISEDNLNTLFKNFSQADVSTSRKFGGSGLGLAISKALVEGMGGRISVQSEVGKGSNFSAELPFCYDSESCLPVVSCIIGKKVLVVDDHPVVRDVVVEYLRQLGVQASSIDSGDSAIQKLHEARFCNEPFSAVLIDYSMAGMDGFITAEIIREHLDAALPIVMMFTTEELGKGLEGCRELRIDGYLSKPVSLGRLQVALGILWDEGVEGGAEIQNDPELPVVQRELSPLSSEYRPQLLLAEDNTFNQKLAMALASKKNWEMTVVTDGQAAVDAISARSFDLVLMDVQMPVVDGLEATRRIRQICHERKLNISIIGMTASAMSGDRERCLEAGMDDYVAKPIKPECFYEVIERYLDKTSNSPSRSMSGQRLDYAFTQNVQKNKTLMAELVRDFLEDYPRVMEELRAGIGNQQCGEVEVLAHNLKSVIGFFNADVAFQMARQLETAAHEEDLENVRDVFLMLEGELRQVRENLMAM